MALTRSSSRTHLDLRYTLPRIEDEVMANEGRKRRSSESARAESAGPNIIMT